MIWNVKQINTRIISSNFKCYGLDDNIFYGNVTMAMTEADKKSNLLEKILEFNSKAISRTKKDNEKN